MPQLPSLPEGATLREVFQANPASAKPLLEFHEVVMRGPSALTAGERELIAAYVSGLNACRYCTGVHSATAAAFGLDESLLAGLIEDPEAAAPDPRMAPVLRYVEKLTRSPARMTKADAEAILAAGWPEQALADAVLVAALYNLMNRLVEGLGISADQAYCAAAGARLKDQGYAAMIGMLGLD